MNLRQLEAFRAVMIVGSVTGAAKMLNVSQPGVSRLIADLERSIGFKLFIRRKGRLHPSEDGVNFYEDLERSFVGIESLKETAREIKEFKRGHLRIAAMPALCLDLLPRTIKQFSKKHPGLKITLEVHSSPRIVEWVAARHFDIGIGLLTLDQPGVEIAHSFRTRCVFVAPAGHPLEKKKSIRPKDLEGEPFVALAQHTLAALQIDQTFNKANVRRDIRIETQPSFSACSLVAQGIGVGLVDNLTADFFSHKNIISRPFNPLVPFDFRIIRPTKPIQSRVASMFSEEACNFFLSEDNITAL
ncbi:MAG: LysR family transcriptional regulator [Rhodospirillales bacterium]|nr:LysR family transcriptional regulator [Rhodospirillales bacterium]